MATVPSQMLWMLVKDWNCYQRKGPQNGAIFTSEPGNLYNKHSYKHSGDWWAGQSRNRATISGLITSSAAACAVAPFSLT